MAVTMKDYAATQQDPLRQGVVDMLWQSSRLMQYLHFIQSKGLTYPYSKRTKRSGVGTRSLNAQFAVQQGNYAPDIESMSVLGGQIETDSVFLEFKPTLRENNIAGTMESAGLMFDRLMIRGDPSKPGAVNEFYGLQPRLRLASKTIPQATNGGPPTHMKVSELQDMVAGPNSEKKLLLNRTTRRNFSEDVKKNAGGKGVFDTGKQLQEYDGSQIVEVEKDENDSEILPFDEAEGSSGAVCTSIICVRFGGVVDERDVQGIMGMDIKAEDTGRVGVMQVDVVQMVAGMGIFGGFSAAMLTGVTNAVA